MHYYLKTRACIDNPAHHALHEFDWTTRELHIPKPNRREGMTRPPTYPIFLKVKAAMASAEIKIELVCPLITPHFPAGNERLWSQETQPHWRSEQMYDQQTRSPGQVQSVSRIPRITWWIPYWWLQNEQESGTAAAINCHFRDGETTCRHLSKRLPDNSTIFAAEATAITLALNYHQYMGPVRHDVEVYSDSMSRLQAIEGEDIENPFICHMNLLCLMSDKGTLVRFCWIPSHYGIEGDEVVDLLAKDTLDQDIDPLANVHHADLKPLVNSYIQQLVQIKWNVAVHGRNLYLLKPTLGAQKTFQHLTRAEEVVITRLRIGHTKSTKSHILSRGHPTTCHHRGQTLTNDHILLWCAVLQECRDKYYTADSMSYLFEIIPETCIVKFLREAGYCYLIWMVRHSIQSLTWTNPKLMHFLASWMLHIWLLEERLWDDPRGLHNKSSERSRILYLIWMVIYPVQLFI